LILVTGAAGFIGRNLVRELVYKKQSVLAVDLEELENPAIGGEYLKFIRGDLRNNDTLNEIFNHNIDAVVHLAAFTRVLDSVNRPRDYFVNNVVVTENLLELAVQNKVKKFLFASSNAVAGDVGFSLITAKNSLSPQSPYGATKAASEMMLSAFQYSYGIQTVRLRFTNIYGTDMATKDSFIARLCKATMGNKKIEIYGDGNQVRDYIFLEDVLNAIDTCLSLDVPEIIVVGSGSSISVNELVDEFQNVTKVKLDISYVAAKTGEMKAVIVDNSTLKAIGVGEVTELQAGLEKTWNWFASNFKN
jgi:UDP-glucose 4-epimerase